MCYYVSVSPVWPTVNSEPAKNAPNYFVILYYNKTTEVRIIVYRNTMISAN